MSTARKMRAPRTEPAIAPMDDVGVDEALEDALGEEVEVEVADASMVEDGDVSFMQDESPDKATVLRKLPPWRKFASIYETLGHGGK